MNVEYLIIGQGLCGTWLSYYIHKANRSFLIIDNNQPYSSSRIAAGIINPVTGRRLVKTWMIEDLLAFGKTAYAEIESDLSISVFSQKNIIEHFPDPFRRESFFKRISEDDSYLHIPEEQERFKGQFNYEFGFGEISPSFLVHLEILLPSWRKFLQLKNSLLEENFELDSLDTSGEEIKYKNIRAEKIVFCDGMASADNPWFKKLPFAFNKGEALIIESGVIPAGNIYKKGLVIAPMAEDNLFWVGSDYTWNYKDLVPTPEFRSVTELRLKKWIKSPFKIRDHKASLRPATVERRPFVGMHPVKKNIGILNGMGTKGCSLAPFFANQLSEHMFYKKEILPEASVERFSKILQT